MILSKITCVKIFNVENPTNSNKDKYLNDVINRIHNAMIKVVTGIRGCGKSYLILTILKGIICKRHRNRKIW